MLVNNDCIARRYSVILIGSINDGYISLLRLAFNPA